MQESKKGKKGLKCKLVADKAVNKYLEYTINLKEKGISKHRYLTTIITIKGIKKIKYKHEYK